MRKFCEHISHEQLTSSHVFSGLKIKLGFDYNLKPIFFLFINNKNFSKSGVSPVSSLSQNRVKPGNTTKTYTAADGRKLIPLSGILLVTDETKTNTVSSH